MRLLGSRRNIDCDDRIANLVDNPMTACEYASSRGIDGTHCCSSSLFYCGGTNRSTPVRLDAVTASSTTAVPTRVETNEVVVANRRPSM